MAARDVSAAPRPPRLVVEVVEDTPEGEVRVHLALDLRLPLNLPDLEALALRMVGELARNAHAAAAGVVMTTGYLPPPAPADGVPTRADASAGGGRT